MIQLISNLYIRLLSRSGQNNTFIQSYLKQHPLWVLDESLDALQEQHCVFTVQQPMVVG